MEGDIGAALEASTAAASGLQVYVAGVVTYAANAALVVTAALVLIMILTAIFKPAEDVPALRLATAQTPADLLALPEVRAARQPQLVAVGAGTGSAQPWREDPFYGSGLSPVDVAALANLCRRIENGEVSEGATAQQRLAFERWLAEHGKLG